MPSIKTHSAGDAYLKVIALGGALPWNRDAVDKRVIDTVVNQNGEIIASARDVGGYPTLNSETPPVDSDNDGMPDYWEEAMGLDSSNPADRKNKDSIGYTMLEVYLNWLGDGHAICDRNGSVDVNLRNQTGGLTFLNYTVASGSNGTVELLNDGYTVRFTAASDYSGLANFTYSVSDPTYGFKFGPVSVGVLITGTGTGSQTPEPTPTPTPTSECVLGDVDKDGSIDIIDALLIAQYYVGIKELSNPCAADVNCDEIVDIIDALLIAQFYVGLIPEFC